MRLSASRDRQFERLWRLGASIAREQDGWRARSSRERLRQNLQAVTMPRRPRARRGRGVALGGLVLAGSTAALLLWRAAPESAALTATLSPGVARVSAGSFVESPAAGSRALDFSDGTRVALRPGARLRVLELTQRGAHLSLESGATRVDVAPRPRARWQLSAGPFAIHVKGTRFDVRWEPERDRLQIDLEQGRVEVSGCGLPQAQPLHAGQRLQAACRARRFSISDLHMPAEAAPATPGKVEDEPQASAVRDAPRAATKPAPRPDALERVRLLFARGDSEAAFQHAKEAGFAQLCRRARAATLLRLADAARYGQDSAREVQALRALRQRFAGSASAARAAFALGRIAFDDRAAYDQAADLFAAYLREQPRGPLAREARGRLLEAELRAGRPRAEALALDYLERYPRGPHAALARSVLRR